MAKATTIKKTIVTHPVSGKEKKFDTDIYEPFKAAIMKSLTGSKGKTFTELTDDVVKIIRKKIPAFKKSIPWYTISIRLELETRGIIETFVEKGVKLDFAIGTKSTANAKELADEIKEGQSQAKGLIALLAEQNKALAPLVDVVSNLKINTEGSTITLKSDVSEELIEKSLKQN